KQRNSIHPSRWLNCTKEEFHEAAEAVFLIQHILIHCEESRIAVFPHGEAFPDMFRKATEEEAAEILTAEEAKRKKTTRTASNGESIGPWL
ncbi:MAG TPA: hypothetical protein VGG46_01090, partial [Terriglobales bacterium]